jgi:hypothetical protein
MVSQKFTQKGNIAKMGKDFEYAKVLLGNSFANVKAVCRVFVQSFEG